jgi:hypothetical protein
LVLINLSKSQVINNKSNDKAFIKALNDLFKSEDKSHSSSVLPSVLLVNAKQSENTNCENERLFERRGSISSPNYPNGYLNRTSCMWFIIGSNPNDIITIRYQFVSCLKFFKSKPFSKWILIFINIWLVLTI